MPPRGLLTPMQRCQGESSWLGLHLFIIIIFLIGVQRFTGCCQLLPWVPSPPLFLDLFFADWVEGAVGTMMTKLHVHAQTLPAKYISMELLQSRCSRAGGERRRRRQGERESSKDRAGRNRRDFQSRSKGEMACSASSPLPKLKWKRLLMRIEVCHGS